MCNCNNINNNDNTYNKLLKSHHKSQSIKIKKETNEDNFDNIFKIIMLGNSNVGKTSFITRVALNQFQLETKSTIGIDYYTQYVETYIENKLIKSKIQLWDTAGQDRYKSLTSNYYRNANCLIAMFAIDDIKSFENLKNWIRDFTNLNNDILLVIVGAKSDLNYKRKISSNDATQYAKSLNAKYFEVSSLEDVGCKELLNKIILKLVEIKKTKKIDNKIY